MTLSLLVFAGDLHGPAVALTVAEDGMTRWLAGFPTARPYGVVELTPEREYLLVSEFFDGAVELGRPRSTRG